VHLVSGQVVFGNNYFSRQKDEAKVWRYLDRGAHLILLAPRRAGKTSLLRRLEQQPKDGYVFLYVMVQSCTTEHDFYKQALEQLYDSDFVNNLNKFAQKGKDFITNVFSNIDKFEIASTGIKLNNKEHRLTYQDLINVIKALKLNGKLIVVFDEYPDVIETIHNNQGHEAVSNFMKNTRTLCQDMSLGELVQFVFTGSIGLDSIAHRLQLTNLINDREKLTLSPLNENEAHAFIKFLIQKNNSPILIDKKTANYLLKKIEWLMPYYIEILWERLEDYCYDHDKQTPNQQDVDAAYEQLFHQAYRSNFIHWAERLKRFENLERQLAKALLHKLSAEGELTLNEVFNICQEEKYQNINHHYVMDCLEHDGYLFESQPKVYRFTSPILKDWWNRYADRTL
jgi:AAA+ ATPase superfamily predicted ATPase